MTALWVALVVAGSLLATGPVVALGYGLCVLAGHLWRRWRARKVPPPSSRAELGRPVASLSARDGKTSLAPDWPDVDLWGDFERSGAERRCYFYPARQCHGCTAICERLETAIPHGGPAGIHPASPVAVHGAGALRYFAARTHNHMPGQRCPVRDCQWPRGG